MLLSGSCHCGAVAFRVETGSPIPFLRCYCSVCRKTGGGGGYAINLGADANSLEVDGREHVQVYHKLDVDPATGDETEAPAGRHFCRNCGTALWVYDPRWPDLVHPFASAIDTELPAAPQHSHMMLASKSAWVPVDAKPGDAQFNEYPDESLADWHARHGFPNAE